MGWGNGMMGGGYAFGWIFIVLFWVLLVSAIVFLVVKLLPGSGGRQSSHGTDPAETAEPPEQALDRMFALGEIDEATYRARRTALSEMRHPQ